MGTEKNAKIHFNMILDLDKKKTVCFTGHRVLEKDFDYKKVGGLSNEIVERLEQTRPATIGAMSRMRGITPASVTAVIGYLKGK